MENSGLDYGWEIAMVHGGATTRMHKQRVHVGWKLLLWFVKGDNGARKQINDISDVIRLQPVDKSLHDGAQSTIQADYVISHLTLENQVVLDPFLGTGTTGISALKLGDLSA